MTYDIMYVSLVLIMNGMRHPIKLCWKSSSWIDRPGQPFPRGSI